MQFLLDDADSGRFPFLQPTEAVDADGRRQRVLDALGDRVETSFGGSKLHTGPLSPGCQLCGEGYWSCLFINARCNANCFFCPMFRSGKTDTAPYAERIAFQSPDDYAAYVETFGFRGVSFSGGEPFLTLDRTIEYARAVRQRLGDDVYIWAYSNGLATTPEKVRRLVDAGLDELRFNVVDQDYDLSKVRAAVGLVPRVTVEIPAVPKDAERLKRLLFELQEASVDHLNLHQLMVLGSNGPKLVERGYRFLRTPSHPVVESELTALETLRFALDEGIEVPINYCNVAFKSRWQNRVEDLRGAVVVRPHESRADTAYLRRLWIHTDPAEMSLLAEQLDEVGADEGLWEASGPEEALFLHPSLIPKLLEIDLFDPSRHRVYLAYYRTLLGHREPDGELRAGVAERDYHEVSVTSDLRIGVRLIPISSPLPLCAADLERIAAGHWPAFLRRYERIEEGLEDYFWAAMPRMSQELGAVPGVWMAIQSGVPAPDAVELPDRPIELADIEQARIELTDLAMRLQSPHLSPWERQDLIRQVAAKSRQTQHLGKVLEAQFQGRRVPVPPVDLVVPLEDEPRARVAARTGLDVEAIRLGDVRPEFARSAPRVAPEDAELIATWAALYGRRV